MGSWEATLLLVSSPDHVFHPAFRLTATVAETSWADGDTALHLGDADLKRQRGNIIKSREFGKLVLPSSRRQSLTPPSDIPVSSYVLDAFRMILEFQFGAPT